MRYGIIKFFEHFLHIAEAMNNVGEAGIGLWDDEDKFFYDVLQLPDGSMVSLKVRSMVGLISLFAVETLEPELLAKVPQFARRLEWFLRYRPDLAQLVSHGNSNWREPIWFPVNYLIIESWQKFHHYYGDDFKVECQTGSGRLLTINDIANELAWRLSRIFAPDERGLRPVYGHHPRMQRDPHFREHVLFYEYFDGETGRGVGASHQTDWTGLISKLLMPRNLRQEVIVPEAQEKPATAKRRAENVNVS